VTLPSKGSREITIDGVRYRWLVRRRPTYHQGLAWSPLTFVVEQAESSGARLIVSMGAAHPSNWVAARSVAVTPGIVEEAVRSALSRGWVPARPGPPHRLDSSAPPADGVATDV
jgi:hypothetical protein